MGDPVTCDAGEVYREAFPSDFLSYNNVCLSANRGALATILAVACLVVTFIVVQDHADVAKEALAGADDNDWLPDSDPVGNIIEHQDDKMVAHAAQEADRRFGMFSKRSRKENLHTTEAANDDVTASMHKAIEDNKKFDAKVKRDWQTTAQEIREITDESYHKRMVKERLIKRKRASHEKQTKKMAKLSKKKRTEVLYKKYCRNLKKIYINAVPKNKRAYAATECDHDEFEAN